MLARLIYIGCGALIFITLERALNPADLPTSHSVAKPVAYHPDYPPPSEKQ